MCTQETAEGMRVILRKNLRPGVTQTKRGERQKQGQKEKAREGAHML